MPAERTYLNFTTDSERWDWFDFRDGDIVISTPPKAGTTLTQMLVALLVFDSTEFPANVCAQHFLDVKTDPVGAMRRIAVTLGIEHSDKRLGELAQAASIDSMRAQAVERAPATGLFRDPSKFFRTGGSREWEEFASNDQLERYWANVEAIVGDDLSQWMHHGAATL